METGTKQARFWGRPERAERHGGTDVTESEAAEHDWLGRNGPFDDSVYDSNDGPDDDRATFPVRLAPETDGMRTRDRLAERVDAPTHAPSIFRPGIARRHLSSTPEVLHDDSVVWPAQAPEAFRPADLPRDWPRTGLRLRSYWMDPPCWDRYLSTLLIDSRDGSRAGFPAQVAGQLARLFALSAPSVEGATPGRSVTTATRGRSVTPPTLAANASAPPASAGPAEARAPQGSPSLSST